MKSASIPVFALVLALGPAAVAGPYSQGLNDSANEEDAPVPGLVGPGGSGSTSGGNWVNPIFYGWASSVVHYSPTAGVAPSWSDPTRALGPVTGDNSDIVSLGDLSAALIADGAQPGSITLQLSAAIANLSGADFAVFENAFGTATSVFAELAYVEVSTDGVTFARFPSISLNSSPVGPFSNLNPTNVRNLAGKHVNGYGQSWGTPFDLDDLVNHPSVLAGWIDLMEIRYIRLVDIPGTGAFQDSFGQPIYDTHETFGSGGFDLEAIGAISRPITYAQWVALKGLAPHQAGPKTDPNQDGVPNLVAYATGRDPMIPSDSPSWFQVDWSGDRLTLDFERDERAVEAILEVQVSSDLIDWTTLARSSGGQPMTATAGHNPQIIEERAGSLASVGVIRRVRVTDEVLLGAEAKRFLRLRVRLPDGS
ncbi:MAG: hypothetical protein OHK005_03600 [Candidatus Methylacidiphilales bacterium]